MKTKFRLFSAFAAFVCVLASGFARGETVILRHQGKPDVPYTDLQEAIDVAASNDFVVLRSDVARPLKITKKTCLYVESCSIGLREVDKPAKFIISKGGSLELRNDAASTNSSFYGQFDVKDGSLVLNGMTCYAANGEPILKTEGASNNVEVTASKFYSSGESVFLLNGGGTVSVKGKSVISGNSSATTYDPEVAIRLLRGDLVVDDSVFRTKTTCVSIGTETNEAPTEAVSCRIVNGTELKSGWDCVCAFAGTVNIEVHDSNLTARNDGVRLFADKSPASGKSKLTLDGVTTITTAESDYAYAIENGSPEKWAVEIVSGTYYRMKKSISKDWISLSSEVTWDPVGQDDNLRLTVVNSGERKVEYVVSFDFNISGVSSQTNSYRVPYGERLNVADITPAKDFAVVNDYGIFGGWYYTADDAKGSSNKVDFVSTSTNLVAGWKKAAATFHRNYTEDDDTTNYFGLAKYVNESEKKIDFGQLFPRQIGWDDPKYSFELWWQDDEEKECYVLPYPMTNEDVHIFAKWSSKKMDEVFKVGNKFYSSFEEAVRDANNGQKQILLVENLDQGLSLTSTSNVMARLDLNGYSIGNSTNELDCAIAVSNCTLRITDDKDGAVYGQIKLLNNASLTLEGGKFVCSSNSVVSADGDGYTFIANEVEIVGGASESGGVLEFYGNTGNLACISNSTVSSASKYEDLSVGVTVCGCEVELANTEVLATGKGVEIISCCNDSAIVDTTNALVVVGSKIKARYGVFAEPSYIYVQGSTIEAKDMGGYAFFLKDGKGGASELLLGSENNIIGGVLTDKGAVSGGFLKADVNWGGAIEIFGGTYAHVASNEFSSAWIAQGCEVKWLSPTCFTVINPLEEKYTITYGWTVPEGGSETSIKSAMTNYPAFYTTVSNVTFAPLTCVNATNTELVVTADWYLSQPVTAYTNCVVKAIENGKVIVLDGTNGVYSGVSCTNITLTTGKWSDWRKKPTPVPTDSIHIDFGTGVADPDFPEDPESEVMWNYESEEYPGPWPTIAEEYEFGYDFPTNLTTHSLPVATWGVHKFSGWEAYAIDYDEDGNPVTNRMGKVFGDTITLDELQIVSDDYNGILHAVWDQGGKHAGLDNFDDLYNDDPLAPVMPGGDTYVGVILDDGQSLGTITVKCGVPNGEGLVSVTATVKTPKDGTVTFRGKGVYNGDTIDVDLVNGEHTLSLTLDSKSIQYGSSYDNYEIRGGVNKFKGSQEDKDEGDLRLKHWLGKWMIIFATESADDADYQKKVHGEWEGQDTGKENGSAHAYGYSYVVLDIKDKGMVSVSGKLANGKEVSSTATAIVGDNGVCVPVVCSIYSGYDWFALCNFARNYGMRALVPTVTDHFRTTTSRGGFGFTAWFSNSETNLLELASENDSLIVNNVSPWESYYAKSMPFTATVVPTNAQRVADIKLPEKMVFYVDKDTDFGWLQNASDENIGDLDAGKYYIPSREYEVPDDGYLQTVTASASTNGAYSIKADGKAAKMKFVDADGMPYIVPGKNGSNYSALKLKYNQKNGVFTGSFKIYSLKTDWETDKTSLKKTKVTVSGGIADGRGYGFSHSKAVGSQPVMLVPVGDAMLSVPGGDDEGNEEDDEGGDDFEEESEEIE